MSMTREEIASELALDQANGMSFRDMLDKHVLLLLDVAKGEEDAAPQPG